MLAEALSVHNGGGARGSGESGGRALGRVTLFDLMIVALLERSRPMALESIARSTDSALSSHARRPNFPKLKPLRSAS